jgi:hypothetical protein
MSIYNVPRCQHLKVNGTQCGSPALKRNRFCFFHKRFQEERIKLNSDRARRGRADLYLPVLEDANSIQVSLMQIMRLLASRQIDSKIASLLLYALQTASCNLRHTTFEPGYIRDVVIDRCTIDQTSIGCDQWSEEDFPDPEEAEEEEEKPPAQPAARAARVGTAVFGCPVERSSTSSATKPSVPPIQTPNPPPAPAGKKQPANSQNKSAQPRPAAATQTNKKKEPKKDLEQVREKIRGLARDWIMQTAKQTTPQGHQSQS